MTETKDRREDLEAMAMIQTWRSLIAPAVTAAIAVSAMWMKQSADMARYEAELRALSDRVTVNDEARKSAASYYVSIVRLEEKITLLSQHVQKLESAVRESGR